MPAMQWLKVLLGLLIIGAGMGGLVFLLCRIVTKRLTDRNLWLSGVGVVLLALLLVIALSI